MKPDAKTRWQMHVLSHVLDSLCTLCVIKLDIVYRMGLAFNLNWLNLIERVEDSI